MSKIRVLSEKLANQIAAGEVIERPASVVKEFLENAVDAGARNISVFVEGGGTRLLRIIDDGCGMDQDDILLCLERHATSKIADEADLAAIRTLGFRGEAIPSIASVSQLTITSRPANAALGTRVEVRYGRVEKVLEVGSAYGTVMEVSNLFGNVPARRKFLKSTQTELFHIEDVVRNYAILCHGLGFSYHVNGREIINLQPEPASWEIRVRNVLGRKTSSALIAIDGARQPKDELQGTVVSGFLVPPADSLGTGQSLRFFVNDRLVRDRLLLHAVAEGLHGYLMKGQRSGGVLCLSLPSAAVDVNVHPTKQEIRFEQPSVIHQLVVLAVRDAMQRYQDDLKHAIFKSGTERCAGQENHGKPLVAEGFQSQDAWKQTSLPRPLESRERIAPFFQAIELKAGRDRDLGQVDATILSTNIEDRHVEPVPTSSPASASIQAGLVGRLKPIGQMFNSYILCESEEGLIAIDQHAAQERILFEALKEQFAGQGIASQQLLFPAIIECSVVESEAIRRFGEEISRMGVVIAEFGGTSFVIKAVPAVMANVPSEETVRGILEQLTGNEGGASGPAARRIESVLAGLACQAAVKAGQPLQPAEIESLLNRMLATKEFLHCPHGRPVFKCFSLAEIKKWFQRT